MAELADALDLGSSAREGVGVQVSPGARRISEMRTRFSDLVFPIGEIWRPLRQLAAPFTVVPPTDPINLTVCGRLPLTSRDSLTPGWRSRAPTCADPTCARSRRAALCLPALRRSRQPPRRSAPQPLFHHAVSKRPDHQLHAIMCPRLCHGGRQVSLHRRRL